MEPAAAPSDGEKVAAVEAVEAAELTGEAAEAEAEAAEPEEREGEVAAAADAEAAAAPTEEEEEEAEELLDAGAEAVAGGEVEAVEGREEEGAEEAGDEENGGVTVLCSRSLNGAESALEADGSLATAHKPQNRSGLNKRATKAKPRQRERRADRPWLLSGAEWYHVSRCRPPTR